MQYSRDLSSLKASLLDKVAIAAREQDLDAVARLSDAAKKCADLEREAQNLERRLIDLKVTLDTSTQPLPRYFAGKEKNGSDDHATTKQLTPKQEGKRVRDEWVAKMAKRGIQLIGHGKRYQTARGEKVGIAFANELNGIDDKWFLGLKDEPTDVAVLICKSASQNIYDLILPVADMAQTWRALSRSKGQTKFNVRKEEDDFFLLVPGDDPVLITQYLCRDEPLR